MPNISRYLYQNEISENPILQVSANSRALRYGDGLFETILYADCQYVALDLHFERMLEGMKILGFEFDPAQFKKEIQIGLNQILEADKKENRARIRINVARESGGAYLPESNRPIWWIEFHSIANQPSNEPIKISIEKIQSRSFIPLSLVKSMNSLPYILAINNAKRAGYDDALLISQENEIIECSSSNFFLLIDGKLHTPSLESGCLPGTMRRRVLDAAYQMEIEVEETRIFKSDIDLAQEAFCTNSIAGIRPISFIANSKYQASTFPITSRIAIEFPYFY